MNFCLPVLLIYVKRTRNVPELLILRPVTLIGNSLGARVIFKSVQHLAETEHNGAEIVERVVLLGAPISISDENWEAARNVVSGRFVNAYSSNDWTLGLAFRARNRKVTVRTLWPLLARPGVDHHQPSAEASKRDITSIETIRYEYSTTMEEISNNKEGEATTTASSASKGRSCKGCLYYSSVLKTNSRHPRCFGLSRSVQVQGYFVGKSELAATREGRSLKDFKYGCLGYSVYLDDQKASANRPGQKVELPVCVGVELLVAPAVSSADHAPAALHNKDDVHLPPKPHTQKPGNTTGNQFVTKLKRNAGVVATGVAKNLAKVGNQLKARFDDILYGRPK